MSHTQTNNLSIMSELTCAAEGKDVSYANNTASADQITIPTELSLQETVHESTSAASNKRIRLGYREMDADNHKLLIEKEKKLGNQLDELEDRSCGCMVFCQEEGGEVYLAVLNCKSENGAFWSLAKVTIAP